MSERVKASSKKAAKPHPEACFWKIRDRAAASHSSHKSGNRTELLRGMVKLDERLVDVAPAPTFWRIVTLDDRMSACLKMLGGVLAGRLVATTDVPT
jgi:hypothetical protein